MAKGHGGQSFGGGFPGGGANMNLLLQQAQKMQRDMQKAQEEVAASVVSGSAGGGMVTLSLNGAQRIESLRIAPEVVDPDDIEMLQDLILAAYNEAHDKLDALREEKMGRFDAKSMGLGL